MPMKEISIGRIKTWQGPFSTEKFRNQFISNPYDTQKNVLFFGGDPLQQKEFYSRLQLDSKNQLAQIPQIALELQAYNVGSCAIPFDQAEVPRHVPFRAFTIPIVEKHPAYKLRKEHRCFIKPPAVERVPATHAETFGGVARLFFAVGNGKNVIIPVRNIKERDENRILKFDLNQKLRTNLVSHGVLENQNKTFALWDGPSRDFTKLATATELYRRRRAAQRVSNWAHELVTRPWHTSVVVERCTKFYEPRVKKHAYISECMLHLQNVVQSLDKVTDVEQARVKILALRAVALKEGSELTVSEYQSLIDQVMAGLVEQQNQQPLKVRLSLFESHSSNEKPLSDTAWTKALDDINAVVTRTKTFTRVDTVEPQHKTNTIEIGFVEPIEWLYYRPAQNTINVARDCTERSLRVIVEMAKQKKMKWIDVGDMPENLVAGIKKQVELLGLSLQVRDSHYQPVLTQRLLARKSPIMVQAQRKADAMPLIVPEVSQSNARCVVIH